MVQDWRPTPERMKRLRVKDRSIPLAASRLDVPHGPRKSCRARGISGLRKSVIDPWSGRHHGKQRYSSVRETTKHSGLSTDGLRYAPDCGAEDLCRPSRSSTRSVTGRSECIPTNISNSSGSMVRHAILLTSNDTTCREINPRLLRTCLVRRFTAFTYTRIL